MPARRLLLVAPLLALVALACGGGADEIDPVAVDAAYARDVCLAYFAYEDRLSEQIDSIPTPLSENAGEYEAVVAESAAAWLGGLRAATPPDDIAEFHADQVARLAAWLEERPPADTADQPEPPREALDRLGEVFRGIPDCEGIPPPAWLLADFRNGIMLGRAQTGIEGE